MSSDILANFLSLDRQVQSQQEVVDVINTITTKGELLVGNGTGPDKLDPTTGIDGQILKKDSSSSVGISWSANIGLGPSGVAANTYLNGTFTVDNNGIITNASPGNINNITPTTTKGDLMVEDGAEVVRLPVGANGTHLMSDSSEPSGLKWNSFSFNTLAPTTTKGDLITEDGVGTAVLPVGTPGQHLIADPSELTGLKWETVPTPSLEDLSPTTTTGDLLVHDNTGAMIALPVGGASDGDVLTVNSTVTATTLEWAAPSSAGGPYNVIEMVTPAPGNTEVITNITLGTHPHNTTFVLDPSIYTFTQFTFNLPPITIAEQGVVYRFAAYKADSGTPDWVIIPNGTDVIEFTTYVDTAVPTLLMVQTDSTNHASFMTFAGNSDSGAYGAGLEIMAYKPTTGIAKWIGINVARGIEKLGGGGLS